MNEKEDKSDFKHETNPYRFRFYKTPEMQFNANTIPMKDDESADGLPVAQNHLHHGFVAVGHRGRDGNVVTLLVQTGLSGIAADECGVFVFGHLIEKIDVALLAGVKDSHAVLV